MTIRIFATDGSTRPTRRVGPRTGRAPRDREPRPIFYNHSQHRDDDGPYVQTTVVWAQEDGLRCRSCPRPECNLRPAPRGLAVCTLVHAGELADVLPPRLAGT